jgi:hypothetical protein
MYPKMFRLRQVRERPLVADVPAEVEAQLAGLRLSDRVQPGQSVAVTAGSRGIAHIDKILRAVVGHLKGLGLQPFLVPSMGSHGGATAAGQVAVLERYGITEAFVGCPIRSSMETVVVCSTPEGIPVHFDRHAFEADHVIVCGRVKPHPTFCGPIESGLMKMILIGLGKCAGAEIYHKAILDLGFDQILNSVASEVLGRCSILAGLAIVENAYDETAQLTAVLPESLIETEKKLLVLAKEWMPRLPFLDVDVLIVDEIGKDISGSGMDLIVVGRKPTIVDDPSAPKVRRIIVRDLTEATHGNATGMGMATFCTTRFLERVDVEVTRLNSLTGGSPEVAMTPLNYDTDREVVEVSLRTVGRVEPEAAAVTWIRNTICLEEVECSASYWEKASERSDLEILTEPREIVFDEAGNFAAGNGAPGH